MAYYEQDGKTFVDDKLTADELTALADGDGEVEVYVECPDNHCVAAYLDDPDAGIRENLTDEAYELLDGEPDVWPEGDGVVGFCLFLAP